VHTSFPSGDNALPRITMMAVPSRQNINIHTLKDSKQMKIFWHPQGSYLAVMNNFNIKKTSKPFVLLFETINMQPNMVPHQQISINRDVLNFHGCTFEPNQAKLAIHTISKRIID
jgi:uncharacterized protein with WD repeat